MYDFTCVQAEKNSMRTDDNICFASPAFNLKLNIVFVCIEQNSWRICQLFSPFCVFLCTTYHPIFWVSFCPFFYYRMRFALLQTSHFVLLSLSYSLVALQRLDALFACHIMIVLSEKKIHTENSTERED